MLVASDWWFLWAEEFLIYFSVGGEDDHLVTGFARAHGSQRLGISYAEGLVAEMDLYHEEPFLPDAFLYLGKVCLRGATVTPVTVAVDLSEAQASSGARPRNDIL